MDEVNKYIKGVLSGKIIVGESERLMVQRHLEDLEKQNRPRYPYKFDEELASRAIRASKKLTYWEGVVAGEKFIPHGFQQFIIAMIFGWIKKKNPYNQTVRRFRKVYLQVAKKNAKTFLDAVIALLCWLFDNEQGGQYYFAATTSDQAGICFNCTKELVKKLKGDSPKFSRTTSYQTYAIYNLEMAASMKAVSSQAGNIEGKGAHFSTIDEYHLHRTTEVLDNMESGSIGRVQPLMMISTTAGFNLAYPCYKFYKACKKILRGQIKNDRILVCIFEPDKGDDYKDKKLWSKANPLARNYQVLQDGLIEQYRKAMTGGATDKVDFRTKCFNQWVGAYVTWIEQETWRDMGKDYTLDFLKTTNWPCIGSLDLSSVRDFTCYYLTFKTDDNEYYNWPWFYLPSKKITIHGRDDDVNYYDWHKEGHIIKTPGDSIDYEFVEKEIDYSIENFNMRAIEYDPYNAHQFVPRLEEKGYPMMKFGQDIKNMSSPTKLSEKIMVDGKYNHNKNPVMDWQMDNVEIYIDANNNNKIVKRANKEAKKVDGPVCLVMGVGGFDTMPPKKSNYKSRGFISLD